MSKVHKRNGVPLTVLEEAKAIAGGLYRMNAPYAIGYVFSWNDGDVGVSYGEYWCHGDEQRRDKKREGIRAVIWFKDDGVLELENIDTGEKVTL